VKKGLLSKYEDEKGPYYIRADAPHVREYRLSSHFNRIRDYSLGKDYFIEKDVGARAGFYGIPRGELTTLETEMLYNIANQVQFQLTTPKKGQTLVPSKYRMNV
jgi:hypothetical protein